MGQSLHVVNVVGARPNFPKIAPLIHEMRRRSSDFSQILVHTGQHYDANMSAVFFRELELPEPDINLEVGSASHARQTAQVMERFEAILLEQRPDWVIVPGDVNSTLACALAAVKLGVRVAHLEAGLRSWDRRMPEEINRVLTDHMSDLLLTPSIDANDNLLREGIPPNSIQFVGNIMIDSLMAALPQAKARWHALQSQFTLDRYVLVTLHRPSNVDNPKALGELLAAIAELSRELPVLFSVHPRTRERMKMLGFEAALHPAIRLFEPLGYLDFLSLEAHASLVVTDSGGVQEETTYLQVPCLTVRPNTERPITIQMGTNRLVSPQKEAVLAAAQQALADGGHRSRIPDYWDGHTASRVLAALQTA